MSWRTRPTRYSAYFSCSLCVERAWWPSRSWNRSSRARSLEGRSFDWNILSLVTLTGFSDRNSRFGSSPIDRLSSAFGLLVLQQFFVIRQPWRIAMSFLCQAMLKSFGSRTVSCNCCCSASSVGMLLFVARFNVWLIITEVIRKEPKKTHVRDTLRARARGIDQIG